MKLLTPDEVSDVKLMLTNSTLQELAQIQANLQSIPELVVKKLAEIERGKGFTYYDAQVRAFDIIAEINRFIKPLQPLLHKVS